jgi:hypothetical protein
MAQADPRLAGLISHGLVNHVLPKTRKDYERYAADYMKFCAARELEPWPVDAVLLCGWLTVLCRRISMNSVNSYMAALPYAQLLQDSAWPWTLHGNEAVRRTLRYLRHRYPCKKKADKMPVTLGLLRKLAPMLSGWPRLCDMHYDDIVWLTASVVAVAAFLRGGEFLVYPGSGRPMLMHALRCLPPRRCRRWRGGCECAIPEDAP